MPARTNAQRRHQTREEIKERCAFVRFDDGGPRCLDLWAGVPTHDVIVAILLDLCAIRDGQSIAELSAPSAA